MDYAVKRINCKTNEIANVCGERDSFIRVMSVGVPIDNVIAILLIC